MLMLYLKVSATPRILMLLWLLCGGFVPAHAQELTVSVANPAIAQNGPSTENTPPTDSPAREALIETIKHGAREDAKDGKARAGAQDLSLLYGRDAEKVGLTLRDVMKIYSEAYQAETDEVPWYTRYRPQAGWIAAGVFFLLFLLRDTISQTVSPRIKEVNDRIYNRLAGHRLFRRKALRKYRKGLIQKYQVVKLPFRSERELNMSEVYVPLKVKGSNDAAQINDLTAVVADQRLIITGPPGSGKSMLLKSITLNSLMGRLSEGKKTLPVLIEMRRLNKDNRPLIEHLEEIFSVNGFPRAKNFIEQNLEQGNLYLLFDGLDEVNSSRRAKEIQKIKDFLEQYPSCRVVITCRTAVYKDEFSDIADRSFEIVEFNDQQVQRFLASWKNMPGGKSAAQIRYALRDRPRIMALARNPLLLTIIVFLYTDTEDFVLPHSRAEFYRQAIDVLLQQLKGQMNRFKASHKQLVLEHLALFNQDASGQNHDDRLSVDLKVILHEIKKVLAELNLPTDSAHALLDEIEQRSGLLLSIDGGTRYQFSHLTLQEYFAASALRNDADGLLRRFNSDNDSWRETVNLWCGLGHDSSKVLRALRTSDPITALECLADAQKVQPTVADLILSDLKPKLTLDKPSGDAIAKAFAAVAAGPSPRSQAAFDFLAETLTSKDKSRRMAAATALGHTNKQEAVQVLAKASGKYRELRHSLLQMGDLAVPVLSDLAKRDVPHVIESLQAIGTVQAAKELIPLLWDDNPSVSSQAALALAALLPNHEIETALAGCHLSPGHLSSAWYKWVWVPFAKSSTVSLSAITGRIVYLLDQDGALEVKKAVGTIDPRLAIPLAIAGGNNVHKSFENLPDKARIDTLRAVGKINLQPEEMRKLSSVQGFLELYEKAVKKRVDSVASFEPRASVMELLKVAGEDKLSKVFGMLSLDNAFNLLNKLVSQPRPTIDDWQRLHQPTRYNFAKSWHYRIIQLVLALLTLSSLLYAVGVCFNLQAIIGVETSSIIQKTIALLLGGLIVGVWMLIEAEDRFHPNSLKILILSVVLAPTGLLLRILKRDETMSTALLLLTLVFASFIPSVAVLSSLLFLGIFPLRVLLIGWPLLILVIAILWFYGNRKDRKAKNPLMGIMDTKKSQLSLKVAGKV